MVSSYKKRGMLFDLLSFLCFERDQGFRVITKGSAWGLGFSERFQSVRDGFGRAVASNCFAIHHSDQRDARKPCGIEKFHVISRSASRDFQNDPNGSTELRKF